jgi:hypothetical protein
MKKLLLILFLSLPVVVFAQQKKNPVKVTNIEVAAPMGTIEMSGVSLDIHDLTGQADMLDQHRLEDAADGNIKRNPMITLIKDESLGPRAYRFAETLAEAAKEEDGINVLKIEYEIIRRNKRTRYN